MAVVTDPRNAIKLGYYAPSGELLDDEVDRAMSEQAGTKEQP